MIRPTKYLSNLINRLSPVRFFVTATIGFGLIFIIITPPFQTPDEPIHFYRAYQISTFNFVVDRTASFYGGMLPKSLEDTITLTATKPIIKHSPDKKYNICKTEKSFSIKLNENQRSQYEFAGTALYPPISYLPQATGIGISRLMNLPPIVMMYIARIFNLAAWTAMLAVAIRLIPRKKWALAAVALVPMAVFQAISLGIDVMTIGVLALTLSLILRIKDQARPLGLSSLSLLLLLLTILVLSKQIMFLFLPLILLIPNQLLGRRPIGKKTILMIVPLIFLGLWFSAVRDIDTVYDKFNKQNPAQQIEFVTQNPHSFINVLWNTYFFSWGDNIVLSFIGNFGWQDTPIAMFIVIVGYTWLLFLMLANYQPPKKWLKKHEKVFLILIGLAYWLAVNLALYVYFSPVGFKIITGLQGRYLLPLAILAVPLLYSGWLKTSKDVYKRIAVVSPLFLLLASAITIYVRYYVNNV